MSPVAPARHPSAGREIRGLGYLVISARDLDAWMSFGRDVLGMAASPRLASSAGLRLRMDERSWRLGVEQGPDGGVVAIGYEVADRVALHTLRGRLEASGLGVVADAALAAERGVQELLTLDDPSGFRLELFYGAHVDAAPFQSPVGARFVTGELGMGHVPLCVADEEKSYDFYVSLLGFGVSDVMVAANARSQFLHCNPRHHTTALSWVAGLSPRLLHLMVQVDELDEVGRCLDRVTASGTPVVITLGKHCNDHMTSFYCRSPSGLTVEYGWGARVVDESTWTVATYDVANIWGHHHVDH